MIVPCHRSPTSPRVLSLSAPPRPHTPVSATTDRWALLFVALPASRARLLLARSSQPSPPRTLIFPVHFVSLISTPIAGLLLLYPTPTPPPINTATLLPPFQRPRSS